MKRKSDKRKDQGLAFNIWALARAPDLHSNIHQLLTSSNNSLRHPMIVPRKSHISDELTARALNKDTWNVKVPVSLGDPKPAKWDVFITQKSVKIELIANSS